MGWFGSLPQRTRLLLRLLSFFCGRSGSGCSCPRWNDTVGAGDGCRLAEMYVSVDAQKINDVALVRIRAEFWQRLGKVGVGHALNHSLGEQPLLVQFLRDF